MSAINQFFASEIKREIAQRAIAYATKTTTGAVALRTPGFRPLPWQIELAEVCDRLARSALDRTGLRVTLSAPPRHGKTEHVGIALPIHLALLAKERNEPVDVLYATASDDLAGVVSRKVRAVIAQLWAMGDDWFAPHPDGPWTVLDFRTAGGFNFRALGATSRTGGIGARLLIADDMIGSAKVYRSPAQRREVLDAFENDLLSRLEGGAAGQMETRRGMHDTTGYLEQHHGDVWEAHVWSQWAEGRGYLWPERYGEAWRKTMPHLSDSSPVWRSLHQQQPIPDGGLIIDPAWLDHWYLHEPTSGGAAKTYDYVVMGIDLAATGKSRADHCAFVVLGVSGAMRDVLHVTNRRMPYPEAERVARELALEWRPRAAVVERAANGDALVAMMKPDVPGIRGEHASGQDKVARLMPHTSAMAAGQVRWPRAVQPWSRVAREQMANFTGIAGEADDIVDALVWALVAADSLTSAPRPSAARVSQALRRGFGR